MSERAVGRTSEYTRTWLFGAILSVSNSASSCGCGAVEQVNVYTDETYPFHLASQTLSGGRTTTYTWDAMNRPVRIDYPDGSYETNSYNQWGQILGRRAPDGSIRNYAYDERGRLVSETDPVGAVTTYSYDEHDRLAFVTNPVGLVTSFEYNWRGDRTRTVHPDNTEEPWYYNRHGMVTQHIGRAGGLTITTYDDLGHIAAVRNPVDAETHY